MLRLRRNPFNLDERLKISSNVNVDFDKVSLKWYYIKFTYIYSFCKFKLGKMIYPSLFRFHPEPEFARLRRSILNKTITRVSIEY